MLVPESNWRRYSSDEIGPLQYVGKTNTGGFAFYYDNTTKKVKLQFRSTLTASKYPAYEPYTGDSTAPPLYLDELYKFYINGKVYYGDFPGSYDAEYLDKSCVATKDGADRKADQLSEQAQILEKVRTTDNQNELETFAASNKKAIWANLILNPNITNDIIRKIPNGTLTHYLSYLEDGTDFLIKYKLSSSQLKAVCNAKFSLNKEETVAQFTDAKDIVANFEYLFYSYRLDYLDEKLVNEAEEIFNNYIKYIQEADSLTKSTRLTNIVKLLYSVKRPDKYNQLLAKDFVHKLMEADPAYMEILLIYCKDDEKAFNIIIDQWSFPDILSALKRSTTYTGRNLIYSLSEDTKTHLIDVLVSKPPLDEGLVSYIIDDIQHYKDIRPELKEKLSKYILDNNMTNSLHRLYISHTESEDRAKITDVDQIIIFIKAESRITNEQFDILVNSGKFSESFICSIVEHNMDLSANQLNFLLKYPITDWHTIDGFGLQHNITIAQLESLFNKNKELFKTYSNYYISRLILNRKDVFLELIDPIIELTAEYSINFTYILKELPNISIDIIKKYLSINKCISSWTIYTLLNSDRLDPFEIIDCVATNPVAFNKLVHENAFESHNSKITQKFKSYIRKNYSDRINLDDLNND